MTNKLTAILLTSLLFTIYCVGDVCANDYHPTRLIIRMDAANSQTALADLKSELHASALSPLISSNRNSLSGGGFGANIYIAEFADSNMRSEAEFIAKIIPGVVYAERDYYMQLFSDPLFSNQWGLANDGQQYLGIVRVGGIGNGRGLTARSCFGRGASGCASDSSSGRAAANNVARSRSPSSSASANMRTVSNRGKVRAPRSRSLIPRTLNPARSASPSWLNPAETR